MLHKILASMLFAAALFTSSAWAGAPFPDLVDVDGNPVTNQADVGQGKWQVVMIWSTDCHVCKMMKPLMSDFHDRYKDKNAEVYGVALDGRANVDLVKQYMIDHKVTFPTYVGELDLVAINLEINTGERFIGTPTYLLFNPEGELVAMDNSILDIGGLERYIARNS